MPVSSWSAPSASNACPLPTSAHRRAAPADPRRRCRSRRCSRARRGRGAPAPGSTASGSPLQLSWPSVMSTMSRRPSAPRGRPPTSASVAASGVLRALVDPQTVRPPPWRAGSRGPSGVQELAAARLLAGLEDAQRGRQPSGQGLVHEAPQHRPWRRRCAAACPGLLEHAARGVEQDLDGDAGAGDQAAGAAGVGRRRRASRRPGLVSTNWRAERRMRVGGRAPQPRRQPVEGAVDLGVRGGVLVVAAPAGRPVLHQVRGQRRVRRRRRRGP